MQWSFGLECGEEPRTGFWNAGRKKLKIDSSPEVAIINDPSKR
jgi:hypothetical protein